MVAELCETSRPEEQAVYMLVVRRLEDGVTGNRGRATQKSGSVDGENRPLDIITPELHPGR